LRVLANDIATHPKRRRACILLWMTGGPSQLDTFDPKPGHENGGEFKAIETSVPGISISEHLPKLATCAGDMALIRSMSTREADHDRATYFLRTGNLPQGQIRYPTMGSLFSKELADTASDLPNFIAIAPYRFLSPEAYGPGFLGPQFAPMIVGDARQAMARMDDYEASLRVENLQLPEGIALRQAESRLQLLQGFEATFRAQRPDVPVRSHGAAYELAVRMMRSEAAQAFQLDQEAADLRDRYGRNQFGQGCLLARRLVERGVPFVEVSLNGVAGAQGLGWDTHQNNFEQVRSLSGVLDSGFATLMEDLKSRGLLENTLIAWMGEFGRTPKINNMTGRDHFAEAWSTVLAGGGIRGGQAVGKTSDDGMQVLERPVAVADLLATICQALGIDPAGQNMSNVGRPIRIVDSAAKPIVEVLG
jgi:uncharacterized protein (DUF1501 family)